MTAQADVTPERIMERLGITAQRGGDGWETPVPLATARVLPPFPVAALPRWVADMVAGVSEATQTPVDLPASVALACLSTAAGGRALVQASQAWAEPVNLYTVVALPPASRKSGVFRAMTAPLGAAEEALQEQARPQRIEAQLSARVAQAKAEAAARAAEHASNPDEAMAEALSAAEEASKITIPELPRLTTDDATPEAVVSLLARHGGRMAVLSAEGDAFTTLTGTRYSTAANLSVFLKGHAGDKVQVDRKGRDAESIERPALTIGITTQPGTLAELGRQDGFRDRGVPARILYALPANTVGRRKIDPDAVPEQVADTWAAQLSTLVLSLAGLDEPLTLELSAEARGVLSEALAWIEPRLAPDGGEFATIADWAGKWAGHVVRIAGLLHLAGNLRTGYGQPITEATMRAALTIGHYYLQHAMGAFDAMGRVTPEVADAQAVLAWITRKGVARFSRRDLFRGLESARFSKAADLDPALELLADHGLIRLCEPVKSGKGGRPSVAYEAHPSVVTSN